MNELETDSRVLSSVFVIGAAVCSILTLVVLNSVEDSPLGPGGSILFAGLITSSVSFAAFIMIPYRSDLRFKISAYVVTIPCIAVGLYCFAGTLVAMMGK